MKNEPIPVTPGMVKWARERAGYSLTDAAKKLKAIEAWESGAELPSYPQLEVMAEYFKVPIAVFFFPEPPSLPPISDSFRTLPDTEFEQLPPRIRYMVRKAKAFQLSLQELAGANPAQRQIVKDIRFTPRMSAPAMAARAREYLGVSFDEQISWSDSDAALANWRETLVRVGVYTFKDAFRVQGYSGFCLFDRSFPIIYVNNSSTKTRQTFTLFHELAHLLFETSGIDPTSLAYLARLPSNAQRVEVLCNRFAAEFLLPDRVLDSEMVKQEPSEATATRIANKYHVSREVVFRKFLDRDWITQQVYEHSSKKWADERVGGGSEGGGNYYFTTIAYLGREFINLAFSQFYRNRIDELELADHLNVKPQSLAALEEYVSRGAQ